MSASAEAKIKFAAPVFQIVARGKAGLGPVGNFVVLVAGSGKEFSREVVGVCHLLIAGNGGCAVLRAERDEFPAEAAAFIDFEQIDGNVLGIEGDEFVERIPP